jgi:adenosylhomocysteine nucleosidase
LVSRISLNIKYIVGGVASGDQFVSSKIDKERILKYFDVDCVEMEGASIAQVCYINNIPFVIIRSMSDKADDTGHVDYKTFSDNSAKNSAKIVVNFIKSK